MSNVYPNEFDQQEELRLRSELLYGGPWRGPLIVRGEGAYCYDHNEKEYLDCESQAWSLALGFNNQEVMDAVFEQAKYVHHIKGGLNTFPRLKLADQILRVAPQGFDRVSFEPSGSLANEAAMKIAMINRPDARYFVSLYHGFHGNSLATSAGGWHPTKAKGTYGGGRKFLGFMENFIRVQNPYCYRCPYNKRCGECGYECAEELRRTLQYGVPGPAAAVMVEPVQGSGGQIPCPSGYLKRVREICDEFGCFLIFDEMQTGFGRCGEMFGMDYVGVTPDMFTIGKALGNGFPIAGTVISSKLKGFQDGTDDAFTFCNNPLAQTAALKTIEIMLRDDIPGNAKRMGAVLTKGLREIQKRYPVMGDVRGPGLHIGVEMVKDPVTKEPDAKLASDIYDFGLENGIIMGLGGSSPHVVKIKPPLIINEKDCARFLECFEKSVAAALAARK